MNKIKLVEGDIEDWNVGQIFQVYSVNRQTLEIEISWDVEYINRLCKERDAIEKKLAMALETLKDFTYKNYDKQCLQVDALNALEAIDGEGE